MWTAYMYVFVLLTLVSNSVQHLPTQLSGGPSPSEGFVQVMPMESGFYLEWGTVCDDNFGENDIGCGIVCRQLNYSGGEVVSLNERQDYWKNFGAPIWLDDVVCHGWEDDLSSCTHSGWGNTNCHHDEDVACKCHDVYTNHTLQSCDLFSHRINAYDPAYPGIGRVEVRDDLGEWYVICDDFWDNVNAAVFCQCLGYTEEHHFQAYWSEDLSRLTPQLDMVYYGVRCSINDTLIIQNIWDCEIERSIGYCDPVEEAATVACQAPPPKPHRRTEIQLQCDSRMLTVCFSYESYAFAYIYLDTSPSCPHTHLYETADGRCLHIPMDECPANVEITDISAIHYCYKVLYSAEHYPSTPFQRMACCSIAKNGSVVSNFTPLINEQPPIHFNSHIDFNMHCYLDDSFSGEELQFPVHIRQGEDVFCRVSVNTWDSDLWLIVPDCYFLADPNGTFSFQLVQNKCPTTPKLDIRYYSLSQHSWGLGFVAPKLERYDTLYLSCDCYLCHYKLDNKPYCDRTCIHSNSYRKRRTASASVFDHVMEGPFFIQGDALDVSYWNGSPSTRLYDQLKYIVILITVVGWLRFG